MCSCDFSVPTFLFTVFGCFISFGIVRFGGWLAISSGMERCLV
jgi:hypothetical protein